MRFFLTGHTLSYIASSNVGYTYGQMTVVAVYDATTITVKEKGSIYVTMEQLQSGQTYTIRDNGDGADGGCVGTRCSEIPFNVHACDNLFSSVPPVTLLGTEYVVLPIGGRAASTGYLLRVIGVHNETQVNLKNEGQSNTSYTIDGGSFTEHDLTKTAVIVCSQVCLC